ncbi:MAG: GH109, partial [uncultured Thermomicrobiales bacterium]
GDRRRRPGWLQVHGPGAFQCLSPVAAVLRHRSGPAAGRGLRSRRGRRPGGGRKARLRGVRDRLPQARPARRHRPGRCRDDGQHPPADHHRRAGGGQARPLREAPGQHTRGSRGDGPGRPRRPGEDARPDRDGQLQLPPGPGHRLHAGADRERPSGRDPALARDVSPGLDPRSRVPAGLADEEGTGRFRRTRGYRRPQSRPRPVPDRTGHRRGRDALHLHQGAAGRGGQHRRRRVERRGRGRDGPGDRRRRDDLPGEVRQWRDRHLEATRLAPGRRNYN